MITKMVAVFDRAVEAYGQPFFVKTVGEAVRSFIDEVNRDGSTFKKHPADYNLYLVGEFDDSTGAVSNLVPRVISVGAEAAESNGN